jgi:hypothetical protein
MDASRIMLLATAEGDPLDFYSTTATLIPVVFFAIAYEAKVLDLIPAKTRFFTASIVGIVALAAEIAALHTLAQNQPDRLAAHSISSVLLLLGLVALGQPLTTSLDKDADQREREAAAMRQAAVESLAAAKLREIELDRLDKLGEPLMASLESGLTEQLKKEVDERQEAIDKLGQELKEQEQTTTELERIANDLEERRKAAGVRLPPSVVVASGTAAWVVGAEPYAPTRSSLRSSRLWYFAASSRADGIDSSLQSDGEGRGCQARMDCSNERFRGDSPCSRVRASPLPLPLPSAPGRRWRANSLGVRRP